MKLLIDANILLDVLGKTALVLWRTHHWFGNCARRARQEGIVSALTFANLVYVMRKELAPEKIEEVCKLLSLFFTSRISVFPT